MASATARPSDEATHIASVLEHIDVTTLDIWSDLDALSTHTTIEGIEVPAEGIVLDGLGGFSGVFNLYVVLQYGRDEEEGFATSDSFLVTFSGRVTDGGPLIEQSHIDTSAFYEAPDAPH